jgi:ADP-dependent NAD(P)H-hydrate dehydratase
MTDLLEPPLPRLPPRDPHSHKGTYGRVLVIGGSVGMSGAVALAGKAALRSGAGLAQLAVPASCLETVAAFEPSYMTASLAADDAGRIDLAAREKIIALTDSATVVACGPGLGRSAGLNQLVGWLYRELMRPMVIDADGLNALAEPPNDLRTHNGPRIVTPHPGEFARLLGVSVSQVQGHREELATRFAREREVVVVLKGHRTYISDGRQGAHNITGNPGMATGGTGDVLTGVIAGLLAQGLGPFDAARLGACVHGLAGDLAAAELGQVSLIASDLLDWLPAAFKTMNM